MRLTFGIVRHHLQRLITKPKNRKLMIKIVSIFLPKTNNLKLNKKEIEISNKLDVIGFSSLTNVITSTQVIDIINYLDDKPMYDRYSKNKRGFYSHSVPSDSNSAEYGDKEIINCPHLIEIANQAQILKVVEHTLSCKPTLSKISIWRSFPNDRPAVNSENYHRDVDDVGFLKVFIYLSDVDEGSGPHVYIDGSHQVNKFLKIGRYSDQEIENYFQGDKRVITGKCGDAFIENTFGVHKGLVARKSERIVLQFEYSMFSIGAYEYKHFRKTDLELDRYINRLYVK